MKFFKKLLLQIVFLVLLLSPFLILKYYAVELETIQKKELYSDWAENASQFASKFSKVTRFEFWCEEYSRLIRQKIARSPSNYFEDQTDFEERFTDILNTTRIKHIPAPKVWAGYLSQQNSTPFLLKTRSFEKKYNYFFSDLFSEIVEKYFNQESKLDDPYFLKKYQNLLGKGISAEVFNYEEAGQAFYCLYENSASVGTWNFVFSGKRLVAVYFLLFPIPRNVDKNIINALFTNWNIIFPTEKSKPAILKFPTDRTDKKADYRVHPSLKRTSIIPWLKKLPERFIMNCPLKQERIGSLSFPDFQKVFSDSDLWLYQLPMDPVFGSLGILVQTPDKPEKSLLKNIADMFIPLIILFWLLHLLLFRTTDFSLHLDIGSVLTISFLVLALIPFTIVVSVGEKLYRAKAYNLKNHLQGELKKINEKIESSVTGIDTQIWHYLHNLTTGNEINNILKKCSQSKPDELLFKEKIQKDLHNFGADFVGMMFIPINDYEIIEISKHVRKDIASVLVETYRGISEYIFENEVSGYKRSGVIDIKGSVSHISDSIDSFNLGSNILSRYFNRVYKDGKLSYIAILFWKYGENKNTFLSKTVQNLFLETENSISDTELYSTNLSELIISGKALGKMDPFFSVFFNKTNNLEIVTQAGSRKDIDILKSQIKPWGIPIESNNQLRVTYFSEKMPGYLIVSGISLDLLHKHLLSERKKSLGGLIMLILITLATLKVISNEMSLPIQKMINSLKKVADNNLDSFLNESQGDELGEASIILNQMICWLKEKRTMSRFVSNQVLKVVSGLNSNLECEPTENDAVLLVSDIRSFTSISEKHHPRDVFILLNTHFQAMTEIINKHGGDIERYVGDAIQAIFPVKSDNNAQIQAVNAAFEMMDNLKRINAKRNKCGLFEYKIGIGIESGRVITGITGDKNVKLDMTVLGEKMQSAVELENLSKYATETNIICSDEIKKTISSNFSFLPLYTSDHKLAWELSNRDIPSFQVDEKIEDEKLVFQQTNVISSLEKSDFYENRFSNGKALYYFLCFIVWTIPVFLIFSYLNSIKNFEQIRLVSTSTQLLEDVSKKVEKSINPETQISVFLHENLKDLALKLNECDESNRKRELENFMSSLCKNFPNSGWYYLESNNKLEDLDRLEKNSIENISVASGGVNVKASKSRMQKIFFAFQSAFRNRITSMIKESDMYSEAKMLFSNDDFKPLIQSSIGNLQPIIFENRPQLFTWIPLDISMFSKNAATKNTSEAENLWNLLRTNQHLKSALFFFADPKDINPETGKKILIKNLERISIHSALIGINSRSELTKLFASSDFLTNEEYKELLNSVIQKGNSSGKKGDLIFVAREIPSENGCLLVLVQKIKQYGNILFFSQLLLVIFGILWLSSGFWIFIQRGLFRKLTFFPLKAKLSFSCISVLLLMLIFCWLTIENNFYEQKALSKLFIQKNQLIDFKQIELESKLYLGWYCGIINKKLDDSNFLSFISSIDNTDSPTANTKATSLITDLYSSLLNIGVNSRYPIVCGAENLVINLVDGFTLSEKRFWRKCLILSFLETIDKIVSVSALCIENKRLSKDQLHKRKLKSGKIRSNDFENYILEEFNKLFCLVLLPKDVSRILYSLTDIIEMTMLGDKTLYFYHRYIQSNTIAQIVLIAEIGIDEIYRTLFTSRYNAKRMPAHILFKDKLLFQPEYPFCIYLPDLKGNQISYRVEGLASFSDYFMLKITALSDTSFSLFEGKENNESFKSIQNSSIIKNLVFYQNIPVAEFFSDINSELFISRVFLVSIFLLFSIIIIPFSKNFLEPISFLINSAREVMHENYTNMLPAFKQSEFQNLSKAFNTMLTGVNERIRLQKFVSESVRKVAGNEVLEKNAREGENLEVTVLFSGLSGFKNRLSTVPPGELIILLNRYLESMSSIIRNNNGEIDKFIGDKILAVFHHSKFTSGSDASLAAVKSAVEMIRKIKETEIGMSDFIGIGIVTGPVIAGIIGNSLQRSEYTVLGDTVNLASRLCDLACKTSGKTGGYIILEAETRKMLVNSSLFDASEKLEKLDLPPIKGKTKSVSAYSLNI
ncbi:MAG: adenylate/guanylate cyclase domain-containing protein [Candidatus Riflebacteria bacterium]|nr:adenylate/guanylate cyclase domain-containing protein [Candidatus Riflebacteria bacterium]